MDRRRIALAELDRLQKISTAGCSAESAAEITEEIRFEIAMFNPITENAPATSGIGGFQILQGYSAETPRAEPLTGAAVGRFGKFAHTCRVSRAARGHVPRWGIGFGEPPSPRELEGPGP